MITTKQKLRECLRNELGAYHSSFIQFAIHCKMTLCGNEFLPSFQVLYSLRKYEFYLNTPKQTIIIKIKRLFWHFLFRNRQLKHSIFIEPNCLGECATLMHPGFRKIPQFVKIGTNCTILPMVLIGKRKPGVQGNAIIGNGCYISTGVTILAPIKIGDNVTIGAGAVVVKDVPSNVTIAGVPAKNIMKAGNETVI